MASTTIELVEAPLHHFDGAFPAPDKTSTSDSGRDAGPSRPPRTLESSLQLDNSTTQDVISPLPAPTTVSQPLERWNQPRSNMLRVFAAFWSLLVMGMNDAAYGAIIPYMGPYYGLSFTLVSLIFLSPFVGYTLAAFSNNLVHVRFGQRGVAVLCSACHLIAYVVVVVHPPYPVLVVAYMLAGLGNGFGDAAWNVSDLLAPVSTR